jgi:hypothetical protein
MSTQDDKPFVTRKEFLDLLELADKLASENEKLRAELKRLKQSAEPESGGRVR